MCAAAKGYSLHIGLNFVDPAHYGGWDGELVACEADAEDMEALASAAGFATNKLLRGQATRDAVFEQIRAAAQSLQSGDIFLLTYSGHGGRMPDVPGGDEPDGNDETWCLFDGQVIDDEFELLWHDFAAGVRILMISDSCHSGTITRAPALLGGDRAPPPLRVRTPPAAVLRRVYLAHQATYLRLQLAAKAGLRARRGQLGCTVRLLSGCADTEYSYDGPENGQFTGALLATWDLGRFAGDYADFHGRILERVRHMQTPQHNVIGRSDPAFDAQRPFTIASSADRAQLKAVFSAATRGASERATLAIVNYMVDNGREKQVNSWRFQTPATDWGMEGASWRAAAEAIVANFNGLEPNGVQIDPADQDVRNGILNLNDKPLSEFHLFLMYMAERGDTGSRFALREADELERFA